MSINKDINFMVCSNNSFHLCAQHKTMCINMFDNTRELKNWKINNRRVKL